MLCSNRFHPFVAASAAALAAILAGCQSSMPADIYSSFGPGVKFDGLGSTFDWSPPAQATMKKQEAERPYLHGLILEAVDGELVRKGYARASGKADLWIAYEVNAAEQVDALSGEAYTAGIYGLSIFDPETSKRIYSATAKIRVNPKAPPAEGKATVENATRRMLEQFPTSKKSGK